jgi:RNA polymerase-binding transcription factor DksA
MEAHEARVILEQRRRALLRSWRSRQVEEGELLGDRRPEWYEVSASERLAGLVERIGEREVGELREIGAALHRIADGTWGRCETCGEPVPAARLRVVPEARFCVSCAPESAGTRTGPATLDVDDGGLLSDIAEGMGAFEESEWGTCSRCGARLEVPESRLCEECGAPVELAARS